MHPLRRRLENSALLAGLLGRLAAGYVRACNRTVRWEKRGFDGIEAALADGPVILVMWHSRILMAPAHLEPLARFTTLRDPSPAGRVSGAMQARFGMAPVEMSAKASNQAASRAVLRRLRGGLSVGLTADGPLGPARVMKSAPLDWARVSGVPVFFYAFACTRARRLKTWDRMLLPRLFGRGHMAVARWDRDIPRQADAETLEALRLEMETALSAHQASVDEALGQDAGP